MGVVIPFKPRQKNIPQYNEDDFEDRYEAILCIEMMIDRVKEKIKTKEEKLNIVVYNKNASDMEKSVQEVNELKKQLTMLEKAKMDAMRNLLGEGE